MACKLPCPIHYMAHFHLIKILPCHLIKFPVISLDQHDYEAFHLTNNNFSMGVSLDQHLSKAYHLINTWIWYTISLDQQIWYTNVNWSTKACNYFTWPTKHGHPHHLINTNERLFHMINNKGIPFSLDQQQLNTCFTYTTKNNT